MSCAIGPPALMLTGLIGVGIYMGNQERGDLETKISQVADINGDGVLDYTELGYVWGIINKRYENGKTIRDLSNDDISRYLGLGNSCP